MKRAFPSPALRAAFPYTLPILAGFLFVGIAYGIFMRSLGFATWYPLLMSVLVFAGSMQFVAGNLLTQPFDPFNALFLTLLVNARHLFYGIAMLERYGDTGKLRPFLIFSLCDETFSLNCSLEPPEGIKRGPFFFWISLLNYLYWNVGVLLGALCGSFLHFDTKGILFVMTALFLVIFANRFMADTDKRPALCGLALSLLALVFLGPARFIPVAMLAILLALWALRPLLERRDAL